MPHENVEMARRVYEEVSAHLEAPQDLFDPDFELDATDTTPDLGVIRGFEASQEALRTYWETFEDFHIEITDVIHADEDQVVTAVRDGGRMRGSDYEVSNRFFQVWTFRDGKIVRFSTHTDRNRALEAAGLPG